MSLLDFIIINNESLYRITMSKIRNNTIKIHI